jgi:HEAT repeat protein
MGKRHMAALRSGYGISRVLLKVFAGALSVMLATGLATIYIHHVQKQRAITELRRAFSRPALDIAAILPFLDSKYPSVRAEACSALADAKDATVFPRLLEAVKDVDPLVRYFAVRAIRFNFIEDERVPGLFLEGLKDQSGSVRMEAAYGVLRRPDPQAIDMLIESLKRGVERGGYFHAEEGVTPIVLGEMKVREAEPVLVGALNAKDNGTLARVIHALGNLQSAEALPQLKTILSSSDDSSVKEEARRAICLIEYAQTKEATKGGLDGPRD